MENEEIKTNPEVEATSAEVEASKASSEENKKANAPRRPFKAKRPAVVKEYEERIVHISRISKTVKGGRRMKFSALVVIGNGKGKYGYGIGKSIEVPEAIKKALAAAKSDLLYLPIVKNDTIPHAVEGHFGACKVFLKPAPAGTGIVAGGPVRAILELAGVKNVYSKVYGSRSSINVIKATVDGLTQLKTVSLAKESLKKEEE